MMTFRIMTFALILGSVAFSDLQAKRSDLSDAYPLGRCPVTNADVTFLKDPIAREYSGRQVKFCCAKCPPKFEEDLSKNLRALDEKIVAQQKPLYPLDTCVVSGNSLRDSSTDAIDFVYKNRLVRFCSPDCVSRFVSDPQPYLSKLDTALIERTRKSYPLDRCIVSGDPFSVPGHHPIDAVIGYHLVRVCGDECLHHVLRNPSRVFARLQSVEDGKLPIDDFEGKHSRGLRRQRSPNDF